MVIQTKYLFSSNGVAKFNPDHYYYVCELIALYSKIKQTDNAFGKKFFKCRKVMLGKKFLQLGIPYNSLTSAISQVHETLNFEESFGDFLFVDKLLRNFSSKIDSTLENSFGKKFEYLFNKTQYSRNCGSVQKVYSNNCGILLFGELEETDKNENEILKN